MDARTTPLRLGRLQENYADIPGIEWRCGCGAAHTTRHAARRCCGTSTAMPCWDGHPLEVALTLVDYEDAEGRSLAEQLTS